MEDSIIQLSKYRYECSMEALEDAQIMFKNKRYKNSLNRSYYAVFHAIRSVNALKQYDSSKHSGVIAFFNQNFVKTGLIPREASKIIKLASEKREQADYLDFYIASREEAAKQLDRAIIFIKYIDHFLSDNGIIQEHDTI